MTCYTYGVYLKDNHLAMGLDLIRFFMEPDAVRSSHITLRGPYQKSHSLGFAKQADLEQISDWSIALAEPDVFFSKKQNTVFIRVDLKQLKCLWKKPDYPDGIPHITLYDGADRETAKSLFEIVSRHRWDFMADVSQLRTIDQKWRLEAIALARQFVDSYSYFLGSSLTQPSAVRDMELSERLLLVQKILVRLGRPELSKNSRALIKKREPRRQAKIFNEALLD
jgi:hypothetical protein